MKRAGFTMIELIFVIVILGILAAVALPKFIGVSGQANIGNLTSFVGTLNRTVGPALWSTSVAAGTNGSINTVTKAQLSAQIETPDIGDTNTTKLVMPDTLNCTAYAAAPADTGVYTDAALVAWNANGTATIGDVVHTIRCMDGSMSASPRFVLSDSTGKILTK